MDAVQAAGKLPLKVKGSPVDLLTISGHKFHGPKGIGALYVRRGLAFPSFIIGGHQEKNRRAGTENVAGIVGMGAAAEVAQRNLEKDADGIRALRDQLEKGLLQSCPDCRINGGRANDCRTLQMSASDTWKVSPSWFCWISLASVPRLVLLARLARRSHPMCSEPWG